MSLDRQSLPSSGNHQGMMVSQQITSYNALLLTTSTRIHLSIRTELDAVDRPMMPLQYLPLFSIHPMHSHPLITEVACHEPILKDRMDRCRRGGIRQCQTVGSLAVWKYGYESDSIARSNDQALSLERQFHRCDRVREREAGRQFPRPQIPPPGHRLVVPSHSLM